MRFWTVGHAPAGTSGRGTRKLEAASLSTEGMYSVVRHPLYLGNLLIWTGVATTTGSLAAVAVTILVFWVYNGRIMLAEERFLHDRFGSVFTRWAARTPALLPAPRLWRPYRLSFSLLFALGRDHAAFYAWVTATTALEVAETLGGGRWPRSGALLGDLLRGRYCGVCRALEAQEGIRRCSMWRAGRRRRLGRAKVASPSLRGREQPLDRHRLGIGGVFADVDVDAAGVGQAPVADPASERRKSLHRDASPGAVGRGGGEPATFEVAYPGRGSVLKLEPEDAAPMRRVQGIDHSKDRGCRPTRAVMLHLSGPRC